MQHTVFLLISSINKLQKKQQQQCFNYDILESYLKTKNNNSKFNKTHFRFIQKKRKTIDLISKTTLEKEE